MRWDGGPVLVDVCRSSVQSFGAASLQQMRWDRTSTFLSTPAMSYMRLRISATISSSSSSMPKRISSGLKVICTHKD